MTDAAPTPPDFWEEFRRWIYAHFGFLGLAALASVGLIFYVWTHWEGVKKWPGVAWLIERFKRQPTPKADPARFSVMVARLADDEQGEYAKLIAALLAEFEGIQILKLDRTIEIEDAGEYAAGHLAARNYLEESAASVLIWGRVLRLNGQTRPQLNFTAPYFSSALPKQYFLNSNQEFRLPALFWQDLQYIFTLLVISLEAEFVALQGRYLVNILLPHIARIRAILGNSNGTVVWDAYTLMSMRVRFANSLVILGQQTRKNPPLIEAAEIYSNALQVINRTGSPLQWAQLQNYLGTALREIGEREIGTEHLTQAVNAHKLALGEYSFDQTPVEWALTQINLGNVLVALGERENGVTCLEQAVAAYRQALNVLSQKEQPLYWALAQDSLGNALSIHGERMTGTVLFEQAISAYRVALTEYTRERVPLYWARTLCNLGSVLMQKGIRCSGTESFIEAATSYELACAVYTRDQMPIEWARNQNYLGGIYAAHGLRLWERLEQHVNGIHYINKAIYMHRSALEMLQRETEPLEWAMTQSNLGTALSMLGRCNGSILNLREGVEAFHTALEVFGQGGADYHFNKTRENLALTMSLIHARQE